MNGRLYVIILYSSAARIRPGSTYIKRDDIHRSG